MSKHLKYETGDTVLIRATVDEVSPESIFPYHLKVAEFGSFWVNDDFIVGPDETTTEATTGSLEFTAAPGIRVVARTNDKIIVHFVDGAVLRLVFEREDLAEEFFNAYPYTAAEPKDKFLAHHLTYFWFMP